jgi:hypothetical protein
MFTLSNITFSTEDGNRGNYFDTFWFSDKGGGRTWPIKDIRGLCTLDKNTTNRIEGYRNSIL